MPAFPILVLLITGVGGLVVYEFDHTLLQFIQNNPKSQTAQDLAEFLSAYGRLEWSTLFVSIILACCAFIFGERKKYLNLAKLCLLGGLLAGISVWPPKTIIGRERPRGEGEGEISFFKFNPQTDSVYFSLPSGHAASTMGTATAVFLAAPISGTILISMSVLTGWSRIKMNEHWPSDVIAGWGLGVLSGFWVFKKFKKRI